MDKGRAMAESQINLNRQNALAGLYRTQGRRSRRGSGRAERTGAVRSERFAGVQQNRFGIQAQQQDIEFSAEKMQMLRDKKQARGRCRPDGTGRQADSGATGGGTESPVRGPFRWCVLLPEQGQGGL